MVKASSKSEAKALGLSRYFTGKPCKHGHIVERNIRGACLECKKRWGLENPERRRELEAAWRERNRESERIRSKAKRDADPDKARAQAKSWRERNREKKREESRIWYASNRDSLLEKARIWRSLNREKLRDKARSWASANPEKVKAHTRNRRARLKGAEGSHSAKDIACILESQRHKCAYCSISIKRTKFHVDHIIPVSKGGSNNPSNLQILCAKCNLGKNARDPIEYAQTRVLLL